METNAGTYYRAAIERIADAYVLHTHGHYPFAMYASGLAVECLLRAFRLLRDSSFEERHDLWQLWKKTDLANIHRGPTYERVYALMNNINLRWRNNFRFVSDHEIRNFLKRSGHAHGLKGDTLKSNSKVLYEYAEELLKIGGGLWAQLKEKSMRP